MNGLNGSPVSSEPVRGSGLKVAQAFAMTAMDRRRHLRTTAVRAESLRVVRRWGPTTIEAWQLSDLVEQAAKFVEQLFLWRCVLAVKPRGS